MKPYIHDYLAKHNIAYIEHHHPAVFSVHEAKEHCEHIPGLHCKNLFLRDKNQHYYLVVMNAFKQVNIRALEENLNTKKLGFASEERLLELLGVTPGSVSPLGL